MSLKLPAMFDQNPPHILDQIVGEHIPMKHGLRSFHNDKKCFTWKREFPMIARRLDYVFTNDVMYEQIVDSNILVYPGSDHDIVEIQASFIKYERGPGYWKLNASYLDNDDFTRIIENVIQEIIDDYKDKLNPQLLWELCKSKIKKASLDYSRSVTKSNRDRLKVIDAKLDCLRDALSRRPFDGKMAENFEKLKSQSERLHYSEAKGAQVRARVKWIENGEKNTPYFLSLEKNTASKRTITSLKLSDGQIVNEPETILKMLHDEFQFMHEKIENQPNPFSFCEGVNMPQLSSIDSDSCEGLIKLEECTKIVNSMKVNTSPGIDGLGPAFYSVLEKNWTINC